MNQSDETTMIGERDGQSPMKGSLLIPSIALGYVPLVIFLLSISTDGFGLFLYSGACLVLLLPIYAVYLLQITRQKRKWYSYYICCNFLYYFVPSSIVLVTNVCMVCDKFQWDCITILLVSDIKAVYPFLNSEDIFWIRVTRSE